MAARKNQALRSAVVRLHGEGMSEKEIAALVGVTRQRVQQLVTELELESASSIRCRHFAAKNARQLAVLSERREERRTRLDRLFAASRRGDNDCWVWAGNLTEVAPGFSYGVFNKRYAHRMAWERAFGKIPRGLFVCHRCDNPPCVNHAHLFLGTAGDNVRDAVRKGRWNHRRAYCRTGRHPLASPHLAYRPNGQRYCGTCARERARIRYKRGRLLRGSS